MCSYLILLKKITKDIFHVGFERNPERAREIFLEKRGVFILTFVRLMIYQNCVIHFAILLTY